MATRQEMTELFADVTERVAELPIQQNCITTECFVSKILIQFRLTVKTGARKEIATFFFHGFKEIDELKAIADKTISVIQTDSYEKMTAYMQEIYGDKS